MVYKDSRFIVPFRASTRIHSQAVQYSFVASLGFENPWKTGISILLFVSRILIETGRSLNDCVFVFDTAAFRIINKR